MPEKTLPLVGAAISVKELPAHADWLLEDQRDLEIPDAAFTPMFDGDWSHLEFLDSYLSSRYLKDRRQAVRQVQDVLDGYRGRMSVHGPFIGSPLLTIDRKIRDVVRLRLRQALEFAAELGATLMVLHSPWEFFGGPFVPHSLADDRELAIGLVVDLLGDVLPLAEEVGCTLAIETIFDKNIAPLLALVRAFDSPYVQMSLDTGHVYINYRQGGPPPDQWVREAGTLLAHLHLQDGDGDADRHWAPGRGGINWYALFDALSALDDAPRLILETSQFRWGADWLAAQGYVR
jgi:sugar phosphate isomerase/epimerase